MGIPLVIRHEVFRAFTLFTFDTRWLERALAGSFSYLVIPKDHWSVDQDAVVEEPVDPGHFRWTHTVLYLSPNDVEILESK